MMKNAGERLGACGEGFEINHKIALVIKAKAVPIKAPLNTSDG